MFAFVPFKVPVLAFFGMGPAELMIVGAIAVLLFGSRLPEVARSFGKSFVEFKKGIQGVESELNDALHSSDSPQVSHYGGSYDEGIKGDEPVAPKFEPPPTEPQESDPQEDAATAQRDAESQSTEGGTAP